MPAVEQGIIIKSAQEIALMRTAGKLLAEVLALLAARVRPGMTTAELDALAAKELEARRVTPSFLGYRGYPAHICVSVNEEVVHGIPGKRVMKDGDVISIDAGLVYKGFQADAAVTVGLGKVSPVAERLIETTRQAIAAGIAAARGGARLSDISAAVQETVEHRGFAVVREYVGHGIGRNMHEEPQVPNFGPPGRGPLLRPGMALAIEPMVNVGDWRTVVGPDNWTVSTADGSLSAHFEHSIAITEGDPDILTAL
ncbi:MAG: type I methionyl aminopeptidase [Chloroflexi bacterium]|nr:type I methionyl aminopeptidase [Chloroflexota bacterium]